MAEKIRGITIELGGDASGLNKALEGVNSKVKDTADQLKDVNRLLKLDPKNTELLAQKQKLLANQIENTNKKLNTLKDVQKYMDKNGVDKNSEQYMALQREIISTETDLKNLKKASQDTANAMNVVAQAAEKIAKGAQKVADKTRGISTAAAGALTAVGGMAIKAAKDADELNTLAKQTGFTVEELQKFQYAADLVDVSMSDITGSASKLKKAVANDSKELAKLGVKTKNADGSFRDISDIWYDTLEALGGIANETERDAAAMAIFGKSADSLAGIVDDGGKALKEYGKEAEDLGIILSKDTVDSLNDVNDSLDKLKGQAKGRLLEAGAKALEALTPVLEKVVGLIGNILEYIGKLTPEQIQIAATILTVVAAISPLASLISKISGLIAHLPALISGIGTALTWLMANPVALVIAGIVGLVTLIATKGDEIQALLGKLDAWLQGVFTKDWTEVFGPVLGGILNGFFNTFKGVWDGFKGILDGVIDIIRGVFSADWERAWNGVVELFSGIIGTIVSIFKAPLNGIISLINGAVGHINGLIDKVNKIPGVNVGHIGTIPMLANGGVLSQGSAIVGEVGPELLTMAGNKAVVQPLSGASSPAGPVYITVQSVLDGRVIAESTTKYQERAARAHG
jgi:phage-related minor tail protein